jgi:nucleolar protein 4
MTSAALSELFSAIGPIRSAFVVTDKADATKSQGFGFVRFVMRDDAQTALKQLDGSKQDGVKIRVRWAKRRHREGAADDGVSEAPTATTAPEKPKRPERPKVEPVESAPDATRTVLVRGLERPTDAKSEEVADLKKALYKKAKKIVAKVAGNAADISVEWPLELDGEPVGARPRCCPYRHLDVCGTAHIRVPNARTAQALSAQLNNHIFKSKLLLTCQQFEREAVTRKGRGRGGARLIVRNLSWDVRAALLCCANVFRIHT